MKVMLARRNVVGQLSLLLVLLLQLQHHHVAAQDEGTSDSTTDAPDAANDGDDGCPLDCGNGSVCKKGQADFSQHPTDVNGLPFEFHKILDTDGWYCECTDGWTGVRCNSPYVKCTENHFCYEGGTCMEGMEDAVDADEQFCDCSNARHNMIPFMGKYCEIKAPTQCGDSGIFCANGGKCKDDFDVRAHPCDCKPGHRGPHCEFDVGHVPDCTLDCQNDGECMLGIRNYHVASNNDFWDKHDGNFQYCVCPEGFYGVKCEISSEDCGDDFLCFNGGKCVDSLEIDDVVEHACDCRSANTGSKSFAGEYCQFESSSFCTKDTDANGNLFCTNGGTCKDAAHEGCDCLDGYYGPACEFEVEGNNSTQEVKCSLECENDGVCRQGEKDNKLLDKFGKDLEKYHETHLMFEHCVCPDGFFGVKCEHRMEICPGGNHVCLHGSKCIPVDDGDNSDPNGELELESQKHTCDCDDSFDAIERYAGKMCQYVSTQICTKHGQPGVGKANFAFCVNSGTCKALVEDNEPHPGCDCGDAYTGPHCEFLKDTLPDMGVGDDTPSFAADPAPATVNNNSGLLIALSVILLLLIVILAVFLFRSYMERDRLVRDPSKDDPPNLEQNATLGTETSPTKTEVMEGDVVDLQTGEKEDNIYMDGDLSGAAAGEMKTVEII